MNATAFRPLGHSGLIVSPLCLGTMTFGAPRWGSTEDASRAVFDDYVEAGGNFIDTADIYAGGRSEEMVGAFIAERSLRDRLVLATKFTFNAIAGNPNAGGNGRKNIHRALEGSLRRLRVDSVDLYWLHAWDAITPVEEVLQSLGDLVRAGKIRYFGFSNVPAWYAAKAATLARAHAVPGPIALQLEYSLTERAIEREHVPVARECGLGITPWSPLAAGFLAGKYQRETKGASGEGRLTGPNPFQDSKFTEHNWRVLDVLRGVAGEVGRPMAQVALAWAATKPGVSSLILGASRREQLQDHFASLSLRLSAEHLRVLDAAGAPEPTYPYPIFETAINRSIFGGVTVEGGV